MENTCAVTEADVLSRIVARDDVTFSPDVAQAILQLQLCETDVQRMHDLAERNQQGNLSEAERDEMEVYMRVGNFLSLLKSKARKSLQDADTG